MFALVRLVIARCSVDYAGRLTAHLPMAPRLLLVKADGSISIHADGAYKALNWMKASASAAYVALPPVRRREGAVVGSPWHELERP